MNKLFQYLWDLIKMGSLCAEEGGCYSLQINHALVFIVEEKVQNIHFSLVLAMIGISLSYLC